MKICVDIGNTYVKAVVFDENQQLDFIRFQLNDLEVFKVFVEKHNPLKSAIICSVRETPAELLNLFDKSSKVIILDHTTPLPFRNEYETPETLGLDRIAGVAAAFALFPKKSVLVIDMGTCITYDLLRCDGIYLGGMISPGIFMRFKAMHAFTGKLPLVDPEMNISFIGKTTKTSLQAGVIHGIQAEIQGIIMEFSSNYKDLTVLIGGGDNKYFDKKFNCSIFAASNLVLEGLKVILDFNDIQ
jgi:type III pantothenate kinase